MRCQGEAHKNSFIDNCLLCAPNWGWIPTPRPDGAVAAVRKHNSADTWEWVTVYRTADLDLEADRHTRYTVSCEAHNETIATSSQRDARRLMRTTEEWCSRCAGLEIGTWVQLDNGAEREIVGREPSRTGGTGWCYVMKDPTDPGAIFIIHDTHIECVL
jgi:hypothetical protein